MSDDDLDDSSIAEVAQGADVVIDRLTGETRKRTDKEEVVQRLILVLSEEYRYPLNTI